ncbi:MAG: hypothetical protein LCH54_05155 [Bacteroidetes bacterium]|nr:hypothetical protein [Bacteroidota bacterium]
MNFSKMSFFTFLVFAGMTISGCTSDYTRFSSNGHQQIKQIKKVGIITPDVKVYELGAGGANTPLGKQTEIARNFLFENTKVSLQNLGMKVRKIDLQGGDSLLFQETLAMYRTVDDAILGKKTSDTKKKFEYDLGSLDSLALYYDVDAFLFLRGYDTEPSSNRSAAAVAGVVTGVLFGVGVILHEPSFLSVGLADRDGKILFYNFNNEMDTWNYTKEKDVKKLTEKLFKEFSKKK